MNPTETPTYREFPIDEFTISDNDTLSLNSPTLSLSSISDLETELHSSTDILNITVTESTAHLLPELMIPNNTVLDSYSPPTIPIIMNPSPLYNLPIRGSKQLQRPLEANTKRLNILLNTTIAF